MEGTKTCPWEKGYYKLKGIDNLVFHVNGEQCKMEGVSGDSAGFEDGTWKFGQFEEARPEIAKHTGKKNYNVDFNLWNGIWKGKGIIRDDGRKMTIWFVTNELDSFEKMSEQDYAAFKDSADPADAPPSHYKAQPEFNGKLLWISGAPGLGKSTVGLYLSRKAGYVYYEADAFGMNANPYIPPDVGDEPSFATFRQKPLKGVPQDRIDALNIGTKEIENLYEGKSS